ncbi:MAG: tetratricopeptide repeat protein, partial [Abitibacteriaceae bacterium]|nr:tetratricopeptide repeat protein [Abditibacteriaceae bacterium]
AVLARTVTLQWNGVEKGQGTNWRGETEVPAATRYRLRVRLDSPRGKVVWEANTEANAVTFPPSGKSLMPGQRYFWQVMAVSADNKLVHTGSSFFTTLTAQQLKTVDQVAAPLKQSQALTLDQYFKILLTYNSYGLHDQMLQLADQALGEYPEAAPLYLVKGEVYRRKALYPQATAAIQQALKLAPHDLSAWQSLVATSYNAGGADLDADEAVKYLKMAVQQNPLDAIAHANLARALVRAYGNKEAHNQAFRDNVSSHLRSAIALMPNNAQLHLSLAKVLAVEGSSGKTTYQGFWYPPASLSELARFVTLFTNQLDSQYYDWNWSRITDVLEEAVGILLHYKSHLQEAQQALVTLERVGLNDYARRWINLQLALCYKTTGQAARAVPLMERVVAIDLRQQYLPPDVAWDLPLTSDQCELANVYVLEKRFNEAQKQALAALKQDMKSKDGVEGVANDYLTLGRIYRAKGDRQTALAHYKQAIQWGKQHGTGKDDTLADAYRELGDLYQSLGMNKEAAAVRQQLRGYQ